MSKEGLIHHIEIYVSDLEKSKRFWNWLLVDRLSYSIFQTWSQGISYKYKDTYIVFVQTEPDFLKNTYHRKNTGLNHVAFHIGSKDKILQLLKEANDRKFRVLYPDRPMEENNSIIGFLEDPDGIKVELIFEIY